MARSAIETAAPRRRGGLRRLLAGVALAAFGCAGASSKVSGPLLLHPTPPTQQKYSLEQGALVYAGEGFTVSARPWDYRLVAEEVRASGQPSPFGDSDEEVGRFVFLRVRLENRSAQNLVFNPMRSWLQRAGDSPLVPLENSDLLLFADEKLAEADARGRTFRRLCFDATATVRPGQSLERYLVFRAPEQTGKQLTLSIEDLWLGSTSHTLTFGFEAFPGKTP
jgi:hypothetical protein